ncbi:MAG: hypothetical protein Q9207_000008 [Kuettlingeria erythrocarpa]
MASTSMPIRIQETLPPTPSTQLPNFLKFPYDGTYSETFEDYFINSTSTSTQTDSQFWGLLVNYQFTPVGGCQPEVKAGDNVTPDLLLVKKGSSKEVTVTDGSTGAAIQGAVIGDVTMDADGKVIVKFSKTGAFQSKARGADSLRSNAVRVIVT